jgi:hypothetical protein
MCCYPFHMPYEYMDKVKQARLGHNQYTRIRFFGALARSGKPGIQSIHWDDIHPSHRAPKVWGYIYWPDLQTIMPSTWWGCHYMRKHGTWMCCHPLHISYGCMHNVRQGCEWYNQYTGIVFAWCPMQSNWQILHDFCHWQYLRYSNEAYS